MADPIVDPIAPAPDPKDDAAFFQAEAKQAFAARDKLKEELRRLKAGGMSDDERTEYAALKDQQAKAEDERKRKAGEFDTWRKEIADKHGRELQERDHKHATLSDRFKHTVVAAEFGRAVDYFSGAESSKTILDVDLGMAYLGKFVSVEDADGDPLGYRIVVKYPNGDRILGADGNPAPFTEAIGELIAKLPNRDRILRGSGKTGSGNSGGSTQGAAKSADLTELTTRAQAGDPDAIAALKLRRKGSHALQMGTAFTR